MGSKCANTCYCWWQVDKAKFAENDFDKEFILGKTFGGGSKAVGVRADR